MYVGRVKSGFLMFLTGGFFFLGWLSDLLLLIVGEFKDKDGRIVKQQLLRTFILNLI